MGLRVINALVLMMTFIPRGGLAEIQLSPSDVVLDGGASGRQVVISCRLPSSQTASVSLIRITRNTTSQPLTEQGLAVANILSTTNPGKAVLSSGGLTAATATVTGSTTEKSVTLTMTQANCQDAGVYRCFIAYNTGTDDNPNPGQANDLQNLTVTVPPGNITISHSPAYDTYIVNQTVEILCNGMIGSYEPGSKETWQWIWEYYDNDFQTWQQYNPENGIRKETPISVPGTCSYRQTYYLTLALSEEDSERQYRCKVVRNSNTAMSEPITLGAVHPEGWAPTPAPQTNTASASATGAIVGGVIGGLILIAIVIVLVYFLWYRKRAKGEKYSARETESKPAEPAPYPYPPANTDVSYKSNSRFSKNRDNKGVDNKAMDEQAEGPPRYESRKPPQYDNDYRKGGRNPGFQDEDRRAPRARTNSSDDGGTDTASVGDGNPNFGTAI